MRSVSIFRPMLGGAKFNSGRKLCIRIWIRFCSRRDLRDGSNERPVREHRENLDLDVKNKKEEEEKSENKACVHTCYSCFAFYA